MGAAGDKNFNLKIGRDFSDTLAWKNSAGTAIDITGATTLMEIRSGPGLPVILTFSTANGRVTNGGSTGILTLTLAGSVSAGLSLIPGDYVYDLKLTKADTGIVDFIEGYFTIGPRVSV